MTVEKLAEILSKVENKEMEVVNSGYSEDINGYYFDTKCDKDVLVLTRLKVQPVS